MTQLICDSSLPAPPPPPPRESGKQIKTLLPILGYTDSSAPPPPHPRLARRRVQSDKISMLFFETNLHKNDQVVSTQRYIYANIKRQSLE